MNSIDKLTEKLYKQYSDGVPWARLTDEQACMSIASAITKILDEIVALENSGQPLIAPVRGMNTAKKEALILLSTDIASRGIELMLRREASK